MVLSLEFLSLLIVRSTKTHIIILQSFNFQLQILVQTSQLMDILNQLILCAIICWGFTVEYFQCLKLIIDHIAILLRLFVTILPLLHLHFKALAKIDNIRILQLEINILVRARSHKLILCSELCNFYSQLILLDIHCIDLRVLWCHFLL